MHISFDGNGLALYAAIVGTIGLLIHALGYLRGSKSLLITYQYGMEVVGDPVRRGPTFVVKVVNAGPVNATITGVGLRYRDRNKFGFLPDTNPRMPANLAQGEQLHAFGDEAKVPASKVAYFYTNDSTGHHCYSRVAPFPIYWAYRFYDAIR